jgi:hypothetical protein
LQCFLRPFETVLSHPSSTPSYIAVITAFIGQQLNLPYQHRIPYGVEQLSWRPYQVFSSLETPSSSGRFNLQCFSPFTYIILPSSSTSSINVSCLTLFCKWCILYLAGGNVATVAIPDHNDAIGSYSGRKNTVLTRKQLSQFIPTRRLLFPVCKQSNV